MIDKRKTDDHYNALFNWIEPELDEGEQLLWIGQPIPWRTVLPYWDSLIGLAATLVMLFFILNFFGMNFVSIPTGGFSFGTIFLLVFILSFVSIAWMPVSEFVRAFGTVYAITDHRAIISKPGLSGRTVQSFGAADVKSITRRGSSGGDVLFYQEEYRVRRRYGSASTRYRDMGFFGVPDARHVEDLMIDTFKGFS